MRVLDPQPFLEVMETGRSIRGKRVYLAEYKRYVEQTVIYDKAYHIIMAIMRDITEEEHSRERKESMSRSTIEITDKVIEKQMRAVPGDRLAARRDDGRDENRAHQAQGVADR